MTMMSTSPAQGQVADRKKRPVLCSRLGREEAALSLTVNLVNYSTFLCVQPSLPQSISILVGRKCQPNTTAPSRPVPSFCSGSRRGRIHSRVPPPVRASLTSQLLHTPCRASSASKLSYRCPADNSLNYPSSNLVWRLASVRSSRPVVDSPAAGVVVGWIMDSAASERRRPASDHASRACRPE